MKTKPEKDEVRARYRKTKQQSRAAKMRERIERERVRRHLLQLTTKEIDASFEDAIEK